MAEYLIITVHPAAHGAEDLTVSDAMRQVLDLVGLVEKADDVDAEDGIRVVWRLKRATTNVDLSPVLQRVGERHAFALPHGRGDEVRTGGGVDPRAKLAAAVGVRAKEDYNPDLLIDRERGGIQVRARNFR